MAELSNKDASMSGSVVLAAAGESEEPQEDVSTDIEKVDWRELFPFRENLDCLCEWNDDDCEFCELVPQTFERSPRDSFEDVLDVINSPAFKPCPCKSCWNDATNEMPAEIINACPIGRGYAPSLYADAVSTLEHPNLYIYDDSTAQELRQFVHDRRLVDPLPGQLTMRFCYIRVLEKADRDATFDFLGLPAELRLEVYRELLIHDPPTRRHTAISRASKLVHAEAADVLYGETVAKCEFKVEARSHGSALQSASLAGRVHAPYGLHGLMRRAASYPQYLLSMHRLAIHLRYRWIPGAVMDAFLPLNAYLNNLASFMMESHSLKHLTISLDIDERMEEWGWGMLLYPLRRLRNIRKVVFRGTIPDKYRLRLIDDMRSSQPAYNTLRQMRLLLSEASQHIELVQSLVVLESTCECGTCPTPANKVKRLRKLRKLRTSVLEFEQEAFMSSSSEEYLQAKLGRLKAVLDEVSLQRLRALLENTQKEKDARNRANDDPTVLDKARRKWKGRMDETDWKFTDESVDWPDVEQ